GFQMTCLEPGANLARIAAGKLSRFPDARIEVCRFEDWPYGEARFDVVHAALSFHYVDHEAGVPRVARMLRPGGAFALLSNRPQPSDTPVARGIQEAYARHAPELAPGAGDDGTPARI